MEAHGQGLILLPIFHVYRYRYFAKGVCRGTPLYIKACSEQFTVPIWFLCLLTSNLE